MSRLLLQFPVGAITDTLIGAPSAGQGIAATKVIHSFPLHFGLAEVGATIAAATKLGHIVQGSSATIKYFEAVCIGAPSGDYAATIDLQRVRAGVAASLLASPITLNSSTSANTPVSAAVTGSIQTGDLVQAVVTVSGSGTGGNATGVFASAVATETLT